MFTIVAAGLGSRLTCVIGNLFRAAPGRVRLAGWVDPDQRGVEDLRKNGIDAGAGCADLAALIAREKPDAVMVGTPNHLHVQYIRTALEAGCRVFSEKPVAIDRAQSLDLARMLAKHGPDRLQVGLVLRSSPLFQTVRTAIRERIGTLISFEANEHLSPEHGGFIMRDWRRLRAYCGSALLEKCCHDFDLYNALAGARGSRVSSFGGRSIFTPANAHLDGGTADNGKLRYRTWRGGWKGINEVFTSDADILDHQTALVEFANGVQLAFHTNTHSAGQRRWRICGTGGTIDSDFSTGKVMWMPAFGKAEELPIITAIGGAGDGHYGADEQMGRDLAACWLDGKPFPVPAQAAIEAGLLCMGIDEAQRAGKVVELAPTWAELDAALKPQAAKAG